MLFNLKNSYTSLRKTDYILTRKSTYFKKPKPFLQIFSFDSSPSLLHPLVFLDIIYGSHPKLISQIGGQLSLRNHHFYLFFYLFYLEILPRQEVLPNKQISLKQHTEFDNFLKFYAYFYGQNSFYFQYQLNFK